jgi:hypothetical protein
VATAQTCLKRERERERERAKGEREKRERERERNLLKLDQKLHRETAAH